jgi:hypothetical protein
VNEQQQAEGAAVWARARAAEDLQVGWVSCKQRLEAAIAGDLDPELLQRFLERVRRLAADVGALEPTLLQGWGKALTFAIAEWIAMEVRLAHGDEAGLRARLDAAFAELDWEGAIK